MKEALYYCTLYDYYGELLTDKQKSYFEDYYFYNLTLSEISENNNISRNAVHKTLKDVETKLESFEEKLKLYSKGQKIKKIIEELNEEIKIKIIELI